MGDAIDNIPGVEGVGPGFASKWLSQYGSLDNLVANASQINPTAAFTNEFMEQAHKTLKF